MSDSLATTVLTVEPNGAVGAEFTGAISALGLTLPEGSGFTPRVADTSTVDWRDITGALKQSIVGTRNVFIGPEELSALILTANNDGGVGRGVIDLYARANPEKTARLRVSANEAGEYVEAFGGTGNAVTLINQAGASSFPQLPEVAKRTIVNGVISGAGAVVRGAGFTAERTGLGAYKVTLTNELASEGVMVATASEFNRVCRVTAAGKKTFNLATVSLAEAAADTQFHFWIFG